MEDTGRVVRLTDDEIIECVLAEKVDGFLENQSNTNEKISKDYQTYDKQPIMNKDLLNNNTSRPSIISSSKALEYVEKLRNYFRNLPGNQSENFDCLFKLERGITENLNIKN